MKKIAMFLSSLALAFLAGCSADAASSVAGVYSLDKSNLEEQMMAEMPEAMRTNEDAKKMMKTVIDGMKGSLDLKEDGSAKLSMTVPNPMGEPSVDESAGTWKADGDKVTITAKEEGGKEEARTLTLKDGKLTLVEKRNGKEMTLIFAKKG